MNEAEWLSSTDPAAMLSIMQQHHVNRLPISDRKLRLFACACCRQVWRLLTDDVKCNTCYGVGHPTTRPGGMGLPSPVACTDCGGSGYINRSRRAVEVAERYADGKATVLDRERVLNDALGVREPAWARGMCANSCSVEGAFNWPQFFQRAARSGIDPATQAALLRDIVGNPFRPVRLPKARVEIDADVEGGYPAGYRLECPWLTPTVLILARGIYEDRAFEDMLILADALEDAGCDSEEMLRHLRGCERCPRCDEDGEVSTDDGDWGRCLLCGGTKTIPLRGPHVHGCWALDLILGKE